MILKLPIFLTALAIVVNVVAVVVGSSDACNDPKFQDDFQSKVSIFNQR